MEAEKQIHNLQGKNHKLEEAVIDRYSGADIIKMLEALSAEIFQGAALVSELPGDEMMIEVDKPRRAKHCLIQYIGPDLFEHLSTKSKQIQVDPFPLQLAVQANLTEWHNFMLH